MQKHWLDSLKLLLNVLKCFRSKEKSFVICDIEREVSRPPYKLKWSVNINSEINAYFAGNVSSCNIRIQRVNYHKLAETSK